MPSDRYCVGFWVFGCIGGHERGSWVVFHPNRQTTAPAALDNTAAKRRVKEGTPPPRQKMWKQGRRARPHDESIHATSIKQNIGEACTKASPSYYSHPPFPSIDRYNLPKAHTPFSMSTPSEGSNAGRSSSSTRPRSHEGKTGIPSITTLAEETKPN